MTKAGKRIEQLRKSKNLTMEQLGNKVGVTKSTIKKWECGMIENMKQEKIKALCTVFDVTPSYLMGWETDEHNKQLGEKLKSLRENKNLAIYEMAEELGIDQRTLEQYENGLREIPSNVIDLYTEYFGVDMLMVENNQTALLTKNEKIKERYEMWSKEFSYDGEFSDEQIQFIIQFAKLVRTLTNEEAKQVIDYANFIKQLK